MITEFFKFKKKIDLLSPTNPDIDPYGEEDWVELEEHLSKILKKFKLVKSGNEYFIKLKKFFNKKYFKLGEIEYKTFFFSNYVLEKNRDLSNNIYTYSSKIYVIKELDESDYQKIINKFINFTSVDKKTIITNLIRLNDEYNIVMNEKLEWWDTGKEIKNTFDHFGFKFKEIDDCSFETINSVKGIKLIVSENEGIYHVYYYYNNDYQGEFKTRDLNSSIEKLLRIPEHEDYDEHGISIPSKKGFKGDLDV